MVISSKVTAPNCNSGNWNTYSSSDTASLTFEFTYGPKLFRLVEVDAGTGTPSMNEMGS